MNVCTQALTCLLLVLFFSPSSHADLDYTGVIRPAQIQFIEQSQMEPLRQYLISRAQKEIIAAYYILDDDQVSRRFLASLMVAARQGVPVKLLVDGIGPGATFPLSDELLRIIEKSGIQIRIYHPKSARFLFDIKNRMHDKLLLIDDQMIMGSSNVWSASAPDGLLESDIWISGDSLWNVREHFYSFWASNEVVDPIGQSPQPNSPEVQNFIAANPFTQPAPQLKGPIIQARSVRYVHDQPIKETSRGSYAEFLTLVNNAKESIQIVNPYVILESSMKAALKNAVQRGVHVVVYTSSANTMEREQFLIRTGYQAQFDFFREAGFEVWELDARQMLHAKFAVFDSKISFYGSLNLDPLSAEHNTENAIIVDETSEPSTPFAGILMNFISSVQSKSRPVVKDHVIYNPDRDCDVLHCPSRILLPLVRDIL